MMRIALGTDHAGFRLKETIKAHLKSEGYIVTDFGTDSEEPVDYPDFILQFPSQPEYFRLKDVC